MKVSLNLIRKYVDLPKDLTNEQIAYDMTLRTVEVEGYENTKDKFHDIVVGKILEVKEHPDADKLRVCMVDIGEDEPKQIVCGGSNLYEGELVVISKPGSEVVWHGEGEPVKIKDMVFSVELTSPDYKLEIMDLLPQTCILEDSLVVNLGYDFYYFTNINQKN